LKFEKDMHLLLLTALTIGGAAPASGGRQPTEVTRQPTYLDAAHVAAADLASLPPEEQVFRRYVYLPPGEWPALSLSVNGTLSTVGYMALPQPIGGDDRTAYVWRFDLRRFVVDQKKELAEVLSDWEELFEDPYLTEVIEVYPKAIELAVPKYVWRGTSYSTQWLTKLRVPARHAGGRLFFDDPASGGRKPPEGGSSHGAEPQGAYAPRSPADAPRSPSAKWKTYVDAINAGGEPPEGCGPLDLVWFYTASRAGLVDGRRLVGRTQSQKDLGFGAKPLYYEWCGFERLSDRQQRNKDDKRTDLEAILGARGAKLDDFLRAVVMEESQITGHKRSVIVGNLTHVLPGNGTRHWYMTLDPEDDRTDFAADPFRRVPIPGRFPRHDAREIIFERANGLNASLLTDERGNLQDVAPIGVATDRQVPGNSSAELHAGWAACARCHQLEQGRGFRTLTNDLRAMYRDYQVGTDQLGQVVAKFTRIVDDVAGRSPEEVQNLVTQTHDWEPEDPGGVLAQSRIAYEQAVIKATGRKTIDEALAIYVGVYNAYIYERVTPIEAAASLGLVLDAPAAEAWADEMVLQFQATIGRKDPTLAILARGTYDAEKKRWTASVSRWQWEPIYAEVAWTQQLMHRRPLEAPAAK
jgi:hypothetical protein